MQKKQYANHWLLPRPPIGNWSLLPLSYAYNTLPSYISFFVCVPCYCWYVGADACCWCCCCRRCRRLSFFLFVDNVLFGLYSFKPAVQSISMCVCVRFHFICWFVCYSTTSNDRWHIPFFLYLFALVWPQINLCLFVAYSRNTDCAIWISIKNNWIKGKKVFFTIQK